MTDPALGTPQSQQSEPAADQPDLEFRGSTPYDDYVHASVLTGLQHPRTGDPGEYVFLVTTQVMELWFTVLVHEWTTARDALRDDDLPVAMDALGRSLPEMDALNASWKPIADLTPAQFNSYRGALGDGSGFQSATYRLFEFVLGDKNPSMLVPHKEVPADHDRLSAALHAPSLYDEALGYLARRGLPIPQHVLQRDVATTHEPDPEVEEAWRQVYAQASVHSGEPLVQLGEALTSVAERVWRWRNDHLLATRRAMGAKRGTGGSAGVAWLEKRASKTLFPELWTARSYV